MNFNEQLNSYIDRIDATSKDLARVSGLSAVVISRYRSGKRLPNIKSEQFKSIVDGIVKLYEEKEVDISKEEIMNTLSDSLGGLPIETEQIINKFNTLVSILEINLADFSRVTNFDSSLLYKIRKGNTQPPRPKEFVEKICIYIANKYTTDNSKKIISVLIRCEKDELNNKSVYVKKLKEWFAEDFAEASYDSINKFLNNLNEFDLEQYIKTIHFDTLKVPNVPFYRASNKVYHGVEEMRKAELDFFKATIFSKSQESIFMCNDMPMEDMAQDVEFGKKWMFAIAMALKKGLHLNIIHDLDRSFNEMMLGLESWLPIYMTGQLTPYYFKNYKDTIYGHLTYVSGNYALSGECVRKNHNNGRYYLTKNKEEVEYYQKRAKDLLKEAEPLMQIYRNEESKEFIAFLSSNSVAEGERRRMLASLPIHTISDKLLIRILKRNNVSEENINTIKKHVQIERELIKNILKANVFTDEFEILSKEEFEKSPALLFLANSFYESKIEYTYDEYVEHLNLTKEYAKKTKGYTIKENDNYIFRNIQIVVHSNKFVMISKNTSPAIHFVINHPKLRNAIENFIPPIIE